MGRRSASGLGCRTALTRFICFPPLFPFRSLAHSRSPAMNIFRLTGDFSHLVAIIILLLKMWKTRSCAGRLGGRPVSREREGGRKGIYRAILSLYLVSFTKCA